MKKSRPISVSIPYRLATNKIKDSEVKKAVQGFNSLQVSYKQGMAATLFFIISVSIPYRLATNTDERRKSGRAICVSIPYRLATNHLNIRKGSLATWFQFLIGQLQTEICLRRFRGLSSVSIPYRLATNTERSDPCKCLLEVSIPYRLATNCKNGDYMKAWVASFNSLQVSYKLYTI